MGTHAIKRTLCNGGEDECPTTLPIRVGRFRIPQPEVHVDHVSSLEVWTKGLNKMYKDPVES